MFYSLNLENGGAKYSKIEDNGVEEEVRLVGLSTDKHSFENEKDDESVTSRKCCEGGIFDVKIFVLLACLVSITHGKF